MINAKIFVKRIAGAKSIIVWMLVDVQEKEISKKVVLTNSVTRCEDTINIKHSASTNVTNTMPAIVLNNMTKNSHWNKVGY